MNTIIAVSIGVILGVLLCIFVVMVLDSLGVNDDVIIVEDGEELILTYKHGPMEKPCPTWDGACNCSPMFSCQETPVPESNLPAHPPTNVAYP